MEIGRILKMKSKTVPVVVKKWSMVLLTSYLNTENYLGFWNKKMTHPIPERRTNFVRVNKKKRSCKLVKFTIPVGNRVKVKESEQLDESLDLASVLKK